jgi:YD repeat-containing protein
VSVTNGLGRQLNFEAVTTGVNGETYIVDNGLAGSALRTISFALDSSTGATVSGQSTFTDPAGQSTIVSLNGWVQQSYTHNTMDYQSVNQIFYPDHPSLPAIEYDYDTLGRISQIRDAINLQVGPASAGGRDPTSFYIADGGRGERDDPLGEAYAVYYDQWGHPSRFIDELGRETDQLADHLGRVVTTTYPETAYLWRALCLLFRLQSKFIGTQKIEGQSVVEAFYF